MKQPSLKKLSLFVALCTMLILGCKETPKEATVEETPAMSQISDAEFDALWAKEKALWETQDTALIHTVFADNFKRISPGGTSTSDEELTNELNAVGVAFPGLSLNLESYDICGNMISIHWSVSGDFTGEAAGIIGNGKPYKVIGISVVFVEDGKIVKDDSYWDTFAVFAQTGGYKIVAEDSM